jgi:hypothetical protein
MSKLTQIKYVEAAGKTIESVVTDKGKYETKEFMFVFSDGTYAIIEAESCYDEPPNITDGEFSRYNYSDDDCVKYGFVDAEVFRKEEEERQAILRKREAEKERKERKQLAKLKAKYEGSDDVQAT